VRVVLAVEARLRLDHLLGLLRRGARVQVDERLAVERAPEDREVVPDRLDVERLHLTPLPRPDQPGFRSRAPCADPRTPSLPARGRSPGRPTSRCALPS